MAKLFLRTFGCQMNEYDSARIADLLRASEGLEARRGPRTPT
jgi:tRNA-2-methylthio-N6-dimethylallyladenosine synthase